MIENKQLTYKETGLDWMPEVPEHWKMVRLKYITKYQKGKVPKVFSDDTSLFPYLAMDYLRGKAEVIQYVEPNEELKLVENDEILILWDGANAGEILKSKKGYISSTMAVIEPDEKYFIKDFFYYFLKSHEKDLKQLSTGTTIPHLNQDYLFGSHFYTPPKDEQDSIVQYIKAQEEKINLFIQKKQRFIELLKEQRQSKIDEAVIKGINPNVKFKKTTFDWLEAIPEHWQIRRLGTIGSFSKGGNISRAELVENGIPAILYGDIYTKYDIEAKRIVNRIEEETAVNSVKIEKGDLLFTGSGETKEDIGKCIVFNGDDEVYVGGDVIIFKQNEFDSHFISYSQNSSLAKYQKAVSSKGDIIVHTYGSKLRNVIMPYPPTIEEQKQIVSHIKTETATIDTAIAKAEREIELIREYKEAMIAEAVMGKVLNRIK